MPFLINFFHLTWCFWNPFTFDYCFIPCYCKYQSLVCYTTMFVCSLVGEYLGYIQVRLWVVLLWKSVYAYLCGHMFLGICVCLRAGETFRQSVFQSGWHHFTFLLAIYESFKFFTSFTKTWYMSSWLKLH